MRVGSHLFSSHGYGLKTSTQNIHKHVLWPCLVMPPATVWKIVLRSVYLPRKTSIVFIMSNLTTQHKLRWCGTFIPMYTHDYHLVMITKVTSILSPWKKASTSRGWVLVCYYEDSTLSYHISARKTFQNFPQKVIKLRLYLSIWMLRGLIPFGLNREQLCVKKATPRDSGWESNPVC